LLLANTSWYHPDLRESPSEVQEPARQGWYCFKAHSTQSAATSAANAGITTADILKAAKLE